MMDWSQFNVLAAARQDSLATLAQLATHFAQATARIKPIAAIVAAGSLGRLEIHRSSDLDCVLLQRPGESDPKVVEDAIDMVMAIIEKNGLKPPKRDGIYRNAITVDALCASTAHGDLGESAAIFGKRLQMLLDTRAVIGNAEFSVARQRILEWYLSAAKIFEFEGDWDYLLRDLMRYAHSYWNWQLFKFENSTDDSWFLRQAKLRSSRIVTWFGLLSLLIGAVERDARGHQWLIDHLDFTPLERIALVMGETSPTRFSDLARAYETAYSMLADSTVRRQLLLSTKRPGAGYRIGEMPEFDRILAASFTIRGSIRDFITEKFHSGGNFRRFGSATFWGF